MLPPVVQEDGSTASTETLCPRAVNIFPPTSMKDDFPAPGGPDRPEKSTKRPNQQHQELICLGSYNFKNRLKSKECDFHPDKFETNTDE